MSIEGLIDDTNVIYVCHAKEKNNVYQLSTTHIVKEDSLSKYLKELINSDSSLLNNPDNPIVVNYGSYYGFKKVMEYLKFYEDREVEPGCPFPIGGKETNIDWTSPTYYEHFIKKDITNAEIKKRFNEQYEIFEELLVDDEKFYERLVAFQNMANFFGSDKLLRKVSFIIGNSIKLAGEDKYSELFVRINAIPDDVEV